MKIAIPTTDNKLAIHFGHCANFTFIDVDIDQGKITKKEIVESPPHQPGLLPLWLSERNTQMVIAGGIGQRAKDIFEEHGIQVLVGAPYETPEIIVSHFLNGNLKSGENSCDH